MIFDRKELEKISNNNSNLLVIEFKTWWNSYQNEDVKKIEELMDIKGTYRYKHGLSVLIAKKEPDLQLIEVS